jgi:hypothetical protein
MTWNGSQEKKWEWYKHTKPCNKIINGFVCSDSNCNYAHTVEQYVKAILKRKFNVDLNIVNQLQMANLNSQTVEEVVEEPSAKRQRRY